jgi:hypothetical protein
VIVFAILRCPRAEGAFLVSAARAAGGIEFETAAGAVSIVSR